MQKAQDYAFLLLKFHKRSKKELIFRLKQKNFDDKIIKETIIFLQKNGYIDSKCCKGQSEEEIIKEIVQTKLEELKGIETEKAKRRISNYLLRRGFSPETINETIERL